MRVDETRRRGRFDLRRHRARSALRRRRSDPKRDHHARTRQHRRSSVRAALSADLGRRRDPGHGRRLDRRPHVVSPRAPARVHRAQARAEQRRGRSRHHRARPRVRAQHVPARGHRAVPLRVRNAHPGRGGFLRPVLVVEGWHGERGAPCRSGHRPSKPLRRGAATEDRACVHLASSRRAASRRRPSRSSASICRFRSSRCRRPSPTRRKRFASRRRPPVPPRGAPCWTR